MSMASSGAMNGTSTSSFRAELWPWLSTLFLLAVGTYAFQNYQQGAVERYLSGKSFTELLNFLPQKAESDAPVLITKETDHVTVRVEPRTEQEFNRLQQASKRPGRSSVERIVIVWHGVQIEL